MIEEQPDLRFRDLSGMDPRAYVEASLDAMVADAQQHGVFYLVEVDDAVVGMGGLRRFADGVAEVKRMYVRPGHRGYRLGARLLERLAEDARAVGYAHVCLETATFMAAAHRTYEGIGFVDRGPYEGAENPEALVPYMRYMELALG